MATQVTNGKAFEWTVAMAFHNMTQFPIAVDANTIRNELYFSQISDSKKIVFQKAAHKAVEHILEREYKKISAERFEIRFASDANGEDGDVRDVLLVSDTTTIGVSCKTNHDDLKHSRLSAKLDFVKKWGLHSEGCSVAYWNKIRPVFNELKTIRANSDGSALFEELENKADRFYWPVLDGFSDELERLYQDETINQDLLSQNLLRYLIGKHDFYKIIATANDVTIQGFNFNNTLSIPRSKFPKEILGIDRKNGGTYSKTVRFSGGYTINFRIHNGDSHVTPSLKFAVKAIAFPPKEIYTQNIQI